MPTTIDREVWTGTDRYGFGGDTCSGWTNTTGAADGTVGLFTRSDFAWTSIYLQMCNRTTPHLYCFEQ